MRYSTLYAKLTMQVFVCVCISLCLAVAFPSHTHTLTPPSQRWLVATATVSPLFLMLLWDSDRQTWAEWQCVCGKRPTTANKRRSRQTLPNLGSGDLGVIVWVGRSLLSHMSGSLLTLFFHFLSNWLNEIVCQLLYADWGFNKRKEDFCYTGRYYSLNRVS